MEDYDTIEGEGEEFMWWHELKEILKNADTIHVNEEHFSKVGDILGVELDEEGFLTWSDTGEHVEPHIPIEVDDTVEFAPMEPHAHQTQDMSGIARDSIEERIEFDESTLSKLHVSDLYGIEKYAGNPVFLYNDFYLGLTMDSSEWEPFIKVRSLRQSSCDLCGEEYTNRDYEVPENASMYWVHSCPNCGKRADKPVEQAIGVKELRLERAVKQAENVLKSIRK